DSPTPRSYKLIDLIFETPAVTIPKVAEEFGVIYHTARADIQKLISFGILSEIPESHPKAYYSQDIMHIAFGDLAEEKHEPPKKDMPPSKQFEPHVVTISSSQKDDIKSEVNHE